MQISEITYRFQTARTEVRQLLPRYLLPWLDNIELVDPNVPPTNPLSYFQVLSLFILYTILNIQMYVFYYINSKFIIF